MESKAKKKENKKNKKAGSSSNGRCQALHENGADCPQSVIMPTEDDDIFCPPHERERIYLTTTYKNFEERYNSIEIGDAYDGPDIKTKLQDKIENGDNALRLRDQVNHRFYSSSEENRGHSQWILKLHCEIEKLKQMLQIVEDSQTAVALDYADPIAMLFYNQPDIPSGLSDEASKRVSNAAIERLYSIAPSLNDSALVAEDTVSHSAVQQSPRDLIIRFLFRRFLLHRVGNPQELSRATRTRRIDTFLRGSSLADLKTYTIIFEKFQEGWDATFHCLRDAIYDHLATFHPLPQLSSSSSSTLLGAEIFLEGTSRRMRAEGWDLLWKHFNHVVRWEDLEYFAFEFEDLVVIKNLIACNRYGHPDADEPNWNHPKKDISQESKLALMQGFIAIEKEPSEDAALSEHFRSYESNSYNYYVESRPYIIGRMSKKGSLGRQLAQELSKRIANLIVLVFDREIDTSTPILYPPGDQNPWVRRSIHDSDETDWQITRTVEDLFWYSKDYLRDKSTLPKDYYEYVIISRDPFPFEPFDTSANVVGILRGLNGNLSENQNFHRAIRKYIPLDEQDSYLEKRSHPDTWQATLPLPCRYIGNRVRCWDTTNSFRDVLEHQQDYPQVTGPSGWHFITKIVEDLESHGIVTRIEEYEESDTYPVVMTGEDGLDDLYFYYNPGPNYKLPIINYEAPKRNLHEFAKAYRRDNPSAVFTKGRINVHYCAWPLLASDVVGSLNFQTIKGHMYKWNALPFDVPGSSRAWQRFVDYEINNKLSFVYAVDTTILVCAKDYDGVDSSIKALLDIGKNHNVTFSIPSPALWTSDFRLLKLECLWKGVRPALDEAAFVGTRRWHDNEVDQHGTIIAEDTVWEDRVALHDLNSW